MQNTGEKAGLSRFELFAIVGLLGGLVVGLSYLLPLQLFVVVLAIASMTVVFYLSAVVVAYYSAELPDWVQTVPIWTTFLAPFVITAVLLYRFDVGFSLVTLALLLALILVFFYYWLVVPLAFYQRIRERYSTPQISAWPDLAVLVPAYNEAGYVGPAIESFLAADYPAEAFEVVVVDDGSTDETLAEAERYESDRVTVLTKTNGGKHSALNYALEHVDADYVATVDADSVVAPDAFKQLIRSMTITDACAVAGNVKVSNRDSLVTKLQALEYVVGINTFRRAFDLIGVVTVVPGCLGLFRREVIEEAGRYSADTVTEDFDLTIELLKRGVRIHHSNAVVYTEAPDTWRDLYRQRLRWFRGNVQTVLKHRQVVSDASYGLLHRVGFPYLIFSMSVLPALGVLILAVILWQVIEGSASQFAGLLGLFVLLQVLLSLLAIRIEGDDLRLAAYAPLSIVGYKQFLDAVLIKSIADVILRGDLRWTSSERVRQRDETEGAIQEKPDVEPTSSRPARSDSVDGD